MAENAGHTRQILIERLGDVGKDSNNMEQLSYALQAINNGAKIDSSSFETQETFTIGTQGNIGFGVGAIKDEFLPDGWQKLEGHNDTVSSNYGNVYDANGSHMVWIPLFYFKWDGINLLISSSPKTGYVIHRAFIDGGTIARGFFIDKFICGNINGKFISRQGIDPCSTHPDHNPISNLNNSPANNHGGLYKAIKTRGSEYALTSTFMYNALAMLAYAHGQSATSIGACAYIDVAPAMPKGNLNNALCDINDNEVKFTPSGYSNCALTGSGSNFAKTTHNGQNSGVEGLNGNMWEVASGFIKLNNTDAIFKILKESAIISSIEDDNTTAGSGGAYDPNNYNDIDLTDIINGNNGWTYFGNNTNTVFAMNTDTNSLSYKKTVLGLPTNTGHSTSGTTQFGNDGLHRHWTNKMACLRGGYWGNPSHAGAFAIRLGDSNISSSSGVGGRACVILK